VRIIIECPENILHLEAGYIYADCFFDNFKLLAVRWRTIHYQQLGHSQNGRSLPCNRAGPSALRQTYSFQIIDAMLNPFTIAKHSKSGVMH